MHEDKGEDYVCIIIRTYICMSGERSFSRPRDSRGARLIIRSRGGHKFVMSSSGLIRLRAGVYYRIARFLDLLCDCV